MTEQDVSQPKQEQALGTLCRPFDSTQLFGDAREVYIRHRGELYRLMQTRNGKLILQK